MKDFIYSMMSVVRAFTVFDFAIFKVCLLSIGVFLGFYFVDFFSEYSFAVLFIAAATFIAILVRVIKLYGKNKK